MPHIDPDDAIGEDMARVGLLVYSPESDTYRLSLAAKDALRNALISYEGDVEVALLQTVRRFFPDSSMDFSLMLPQIAVLRSFLAASGLLNFGMM